MQAEGRNSYGMRLSVFLFRIVLRQSGIISLMRPAAGGESSKQDSSCGAREGIGVAIQSLCGENGIDFLCDSV